MLKVIAGSVLCGILLFGQSALAQKSPSKPPKPEVSKTVTTSAETRFGSFHEIGKISNREEGRTAAGEKNGLKHATPEKKSSN